MSFLPCQPIQSPKSQSPANPKPSHPPRMLSRRSLHPTKLRTSQKVSCRAQRGRCDIRKGNSRPREISRQISGTRQLHTEIVPGERRIEIRQRLEGEDINLHLFAIRILEDQVRYEVKLSGDAEHKTVKTPEWLSLLHDKLARIEAKILYARETSKPGKQDLDLSGPAA
jgi:hypothetical protein